MGREKEIKQTVGSRSPESGGKQSLRQPLPLAAALLEAKERRPQRSSAPSFEPRSPFPAHPAVAARRFVQPPLRRVAFAIRLASTQPLGYLRNPAAQRSCLVAIIVGDLAVSGGSVVGAGETHAVAPGEAHDNHSVREQQVE